MPIWGEMFDDMRKVQLAIVARPVYAREKQIGQLAA